MSHTTPKKEQSAEAVRYRPFFLPYFLIKSNFNFMTIDKGVIFGMNGDGVDRFNRVAARSKVHGYHNKPLPLDINKGKRADVSGLKKVDRRNVANVLGDDYKSRFTIGFEVEKNQLHRNAVREYEFFCGFEEDGSCGYEAVSHICPLVGASQWRTKVFDMVHKAEKIIDDRYSPSNVKDRRGNYKCGGHTTLSCDGIEGDVLNDMLRKYSGVVLALFRHRLKNSFCNHNISMKPRGASGGYVNSIDAKYNVALVKGNLVEFRIVSKFESVKQVMRRYELFYELMDFAVNTRGSFQQFITKVRPVVVSMYDGDVAKADKILDLAVDFQILINTHVVSEKIREFMP